MKFNRALAFLISMTMLVGVQPVSALAAENAGDEITTGIVEVSDPCAEGHDYEKKVTKPATETAEGQVTYTCTRCGDEYEEAIPRLEKKTDNKKADEKGSSCKVTLPSGKGYTIKAAGDTAVAAGASFSFSVNIAKGYRKGKDFSVKAGDSTLKEGSDGTYTIKDIKKDVEVKIGGVEKIEDTDETLAAPIPEEDSETADAENGAAFVTDEPAAPADVEIVSEEPVNSGESKYDLYVDGKPVTEENKGDILGEEDDEDGEVRKTAVYDDKTNTLTLDEATLSNERPGPAVRYDGTADFTISFKGNCFLVGQPDENVGDGVTAYGISAINGSLLLKACGEGLMIITNQEAITGKDVSFDEELCLGPEGVSVIPGGTGFSCESGIVIASSHDWNQPTYSWKDDYSEVTAESVCKNNESHVVEETVNPTKTVTKKATCKDAGKLTYTASFESEAFTEQTKEVRQAALGHLWGAPVFSWSDGNTKAVATITCERNPSHTQSGKASVKSSITLPEMNEDGKITYTASIKVNGEMVSETKETVIKPAGTTGYKFTAKSYSWTKGTSKQLNLIVKRNEFDEITYSAFTGITVDGKAVANSNYATEEGSLKLALKKEYLQNLTAGTHTLKVQFKDGSAETKFTITANGAAGKSTSRAVNGKKGSSPKTGDDTNAALWIGILVAAVLGIAGILIYRKRENTKK